MNKIQYIIQREYLTRIRKKTFWILTFLGPVLYAGFFALPILIQSSVAPEKQIIYVQDKSGYFSEKLKSDKDIAFIFIDSSKIKFIENTVQEDKTSHLLKISKFDINNPKGFELISSKNAGLRVHMLLNTLVNKAVKDIRIKNLGIDSKLIENLEPNIDISVKKISEEGLKEDNTKVASIIAGIAAFLNYMFIFIYGSLILRGVQEEKSSRIVEVIISAVRPFELMMGKILGVALVGLTQFILWILLTFIFIAVLFSFGGSLMPQVPQVPGTSSGNISEALAIISSINLPLILFAFIFYFITGYLLYASLFAAVASAVDNQTDMQQFMLPVSIPLIFSIVLIPTVIDNPNNLTAVWLSMIPFTAPVIMMARLAFGISGIEWQLVISMLLMMGGFLFTTWLASKIYRIGILTYGAKIGYKDLWRWLFYK